MKLLPFDLEKAQSGHPWGTRDGRRGKKIFDTEREGNNRLIAILEDDVDLSFTIDGFLFGNLEPEEFCNLCLYEEEKIGWVVIFRDENSPFGFQAIRCAFAYDKESQENFHKPNGTYIDTVEVRY